MSVDGIDNGGNFMPKPSRRGGGGSTCRFARQPWHGIGEVQTMRDTVAVRKLQLQQLLRRGNDVDGKAERDAWSLEVDPTRPELCISSQSRPDAQEVDASVPSADTQDATSLYTVGTQELAWRRHERKLAMLAIACKCQGQNNGAARASLATDTRARGDIPDQHAVRTTATAEPPLDAPASGPPSQASKVSGSLAPTTGPTGAVVPTPATPPVNPYQTPTGLALASSLRAATASAPLTKPPPFFSGSVYTVWDPDNMRLLSVMPSSRLDTLTRWIRRRVAQVAGALPWLSLGWGAAGGPDSGGADDGSKGGGASARGKGGRGARRSTGGEEGDVPKIVPVRLYLSQRVAEEDMRRGMRGEGAIKRAAVVALPLQLALGSQKVLPALGKEIELVPDESDVEAARRILQRTSGKQVAAAFRGVPVFSISNTRVLVSNRKTGSMQWYRPWFFSKSHMVAMLSASLDAAFQEKIEARRKARAAALASGTQGGSGGGRSSMGNDTGMMDVDDEESLEEPSEVRDFLAEATGSNDAGAGTSGTSITSLLAHVAADLADRVLLGTSLGRRLLGLQVPFDIVVDSFDHCLQEGTAPPTAPVQGADSLMAAVAPRAPPAAWPSANAKEGKPLSGDVASSGRSGAVEHGSQRDAGVGGEDNGDKRPSGRDGGGHASGHSASSSEHASADGRNHRAASGHGQGGVTSSARPAAPSSPASPSPPSSGQMAASHPGPADRGGDGTVHPGTTTGKAAGKAAGVAGQAGDDGSPRPRLGNTTMLGSGSLTANELAKLPLVDDGMTGVMFIADASLSMQPPQRVSTGGGEASPRDGGGDLH